MKTALLLIALFLAGCSDKPSLSDKLRDPQVFKTLPTATQVVLLLDMQILLISLGVLLIGTGFLASADRKK